MQELEKILEEIEKQKSCCLMIGYAKENNQGALKMAEVIEDIIHKHMGNDGWIPVEERMPTKEEFLKDDGRFILDDGNRRYQGLFDIYDGKFKFSRHISGIHYELFEDKCVIAWQPLPDPYRPERSRK